MLLPDKQGIKCDCCGAELRMSQASFTYYSMDFRTAWARVNTWPGLESLPITASLDVCPDCMTKVEDKIKVNYRPTSVGVNCDLCGKELRGNFKFHYCVVSKVTSSWAAGQVRCTACRQPMPRTGKCQCGSDRSERVAANEVDPQYLQIWCCDDDFSRLQSGAETIRRLATATA